MKKKWGKVGWVVVSSQFCPVVICYHSLSPCMWALLWALVCV
jgi:hypothetical protein